MNNWKEYFFYGGLLRRLWYYDKDGWLDFDLLIHHLNGAYRESFNLLIFGKIGFTLFLRIWLILIYQEFKICRLWGRFIYEHFDKVYELRCKVQEEIIAKYGSRTSIGDGLLWHLEMVDYVGCHNHREHPTFGGTWGL